MVHVLDAHLDVLWGEVPLCRYVYRPEIPQLESPKPYFHPVRSLAGDLVTAYRPHDHVWHKGIQLAVPNVGSENFWGGVTYDRAHGYRQLANNGTMRHVAYDAVEATGHEASVQQRLEWTTQAGERWFDEARAFKATVVADAWVLSFATSITNCSGGDVSFGSPTTNGRPNAGYGGLLWRGPRSFIGGEILAPRGLHGEQAVMGARAPWAAFVGRQDGTMHDNTLAFFDDARNPVAPTPWFVRSETYPLVCPAPFFHDELAVRARQTLTLRYDIAIADAAWTHDDVDAFRLGPLREIRDD
jgi:hypothetical protein